MSERQTDEKTFVYGLLDPFIGRIRYVGASTSPAQRLRQHLSPSDGSYKMSGPNTKQEWIRDLKERGEEPKLVILEIVPARSYGNGSRHPLVAEAEDRWMVRLINEGHPLTNSRLPVELTDEEKITLEAIERGRRMFGEA